MFDGLTLGVRGDWQVIFGREYDQISLLVKGTDVGAHPIEGFATIELTMRVP